MQDDQFYKRLGACINLAVYGKTEGERLSAKNAAARLLAKLTPEELAVLGTPVIATKPGTEKPPPGPPPIRHREGTKRAKIVEMLKKGHPPTLIAYELGIKVQYVYRVRQDVNRGL